jgi:uncharacterized protein YndB with AHSA1/START domain
MRDTHCLKLLNVNTMSGNMTIHNTITINAPATKVWDALTNPEQTKKYMFGCETASDWQAGSPLLWKGVFGGVELVAVKGYIVAIEPGSYLEYTVIDPNNPAIPDVPENYLTVTYSLAEEGGQTVLDVKQGGFETAAEGKKRYEDSYNNGEGWNPILVQIKKLLEEE